MVRRGLYKIEHCQRLAALEGIRSGRTQIAVSSHPIAGAYF